MREREIRVLRWQVRVALQLSLVVLATYHLPAQVELSGLWNTLPRNQDGGGIVGDAAGVPISQSARWRGDSWSGDDFDVAEWVCRPHSFDYGLEGGLSRMRMWNEVDEATQKVIAVRAHANQEEQEITIWMDGRPHPPANTVHTWSGFWTGEWENGALVTTTTHLKENYIRRMGLYRSDMTTLRSRWRRIGDYLQVTTIMYDPIYLAEPYLRSSDMFFLDPAMPMDPYPCEEATETAIPRGTTPNFLPGKSGLPALNPKITDRFGTPYEARLGGPETMYPEYIKKIKTFPKVTATAPGTAETGAP